MLKKMFCIRFAEKCTNNSVRLFDLILLENDMQNVSVVIMKYSSFCLEIN